MTTGRRNEREAVELGMQRLKSMARDNPVQQDVCERAAPLLEEILACIEPFNRQDGNIVASISPLSFDGAFFNYDVSPAEINGRSVRESDNILCIQTSLSYYDDRDGPRVMQTRSSTPDIKLFQAIDILVKPDGHYKVTRLDKDARARRAGDPGFGKTIYGHVLETTDSAAVIQCIREWAKDNISPAAPAPAMWRVPAPKPS